MNDDSILAERVAAIEVYGPDIMAEVEKFLMDEAPMLVLYGDLGVGKSFQAALAFHEDYLFVLHDKRVLDPVMKLMRRQPARAREMGFKRVPVYIVIPHERLIRPGETPQVDKKTNQIRPTIHVDNRKAIRSLLDRIVKTWDPATRTFDWGGKRFRGVVWDEWSTFGDRIDREMRQESDNGFDINRDHHGFHRGIKDVAQATGCGFVFLCHADHPAYHDMSGTPEAQKISPEKRGKLKYPGRPKFVTGPLSAMFCAQVSYVGQIVVRDGSEDPDGTQDAPTRHLLTGSSPLWIRKWRGWVDHDVNLSKIDLRTLLEEAGCLAR